MRSEQAIPNQFNGPMQSEAWEATVGTYSIHVLGCKVNQYEAAQIARWLESRGMRPAQEGESADLVVVHTCGVTTAAVRESRELLRAAQRTASQGVIVSGCAVEDLRGHANEVLAVPSGPGWAARFQECLEQKLGLRPRRELGLFRFPNHTRAFLKVQDGCDLRCTYCVVPLRRGRSHDRPLEEVLAEARGWIQAGHRELVVSGVNVGLWGRRRGHSLDELVAALLELPGLERLRLSSLHPRDLTDRLLGVLASSPRAMPQIHLPLQSGSDAVLRAMRRGYTVRQYLEAVERARRWLDEPAFTTDIIVGFPGETEEDFDATLNVARQVGFSRIHMFPFAPRPGTPAATAPDPVPPAVVKERMRSLKELAADLARRAHKQWCGRSVCVLVEEWKDGIAGGYSERYMPVRFAARSSLVGTVAVVQVESADERGLYGHGLRAP